MANYVHLPFLAGDFTGMEYQHDALSAQLFAPEPEFFSITKSRKNPALLTRRESRAASHWTLRTENTCSIG